MTASPDAWGRLIGPHNIVPIRLNGLETMALLDTGAQISSILKLWVEDLGLPLYELENIVDIEQAGGSVLDHEGFTEVNITSYQIPGLDLNIPLLVMPHNPYHDQVLVTLWTLTLKNIIDSEVLDGSSKISTSWIYVQQNIELAAKLDSNPGEVLGIAKLSKEINIPAFQTKSVHCLSKAKNYGIKVNIMVEDKCNSKLPEGLGVQNTYTELMPGRKKVVVAIRNTSARNITIPKGTVVGNIFANKILKILTQSIRVSKLENDIENSNSSTYPEEKISYEDKWVLEKLDLSGMQYFSDKLQSKARDLLCSNSDIFSKHDLNMGRIDLIKHDIKLTDPNAFKKSYRRIPPDLYDETTAHCKEMLDLGAIRKSQSPWSSAIVLVKKYGKLRFCVDLRKLNVRTIEDNFRLPRIEHQLEQLIGAEWFSTLNLKKVATDSLTQHLLVVLKGFMSPIQCPLVLVMLQQYSKGL